MKFVKTLFVAALVLGTAAPAFASDEFSSADEGMAASDFANTPDAARRPIRRPRPRLHVCFARNATGRTFSARDWNIRSAQNQAIRACRARSFGPLGFTCRSAGCR